MSLAETMRIHEPYPGLYAYYDGRILGKRLHSDKPNWLDDGAYGLGVASYAIVSGTEALVYDTHISFDHARAIRSHLSGLGVSKIRVVLSHWHTDHVAGNAGFIDCPILSNKLTRDTLIEKRKVLVAKDPPINPVVMPTETFDGEMTLEVGDITVKLMQFDIHSADGTVLLVPHLGVLLAGDTLEDTVTYISEPANTARHVAELDRLSELEFSRILPNHGDEQVIASGGYPPSLVTTTRDYLTRLLLRLDEPGLPDESLERFIAPELSVGTLTYFAPYEAVHSQNIAALRGVSADD
ncbi:glyoxylase-like metal-dependent hydrolase (beta-lactamase superfamily II) [Peteryoungia aggregata LMG 23059]|uniref:Glyoxylase-like metal-dependent hydrolase (Beta-lactamase superfamily II) n=1 Tax=Peteryoungia aggregata LMG 23059 TaxID=1368425 RepID=A0ABU0G9H6_9HYPH|nr:MBL fold metallo-hydrolase [Peteryoungia aggregata]MDQ0421733.1 glyoxylase-like metal-dependent hydrolase (beta-lactamase superfamily II) [Peteryoungia aggregata LMG 23059]